MGNKKEPYIKEKSINHLEDTNSFIIDEEMLVDESISKVKSFEQSLEEKLDLDNLESYVEMKEEKKETTLSWGVEKKENQSTSNTFGPSFPSSNADIRIFRRRTT